MLRCPPGVLAALVGVHGENAQAHRTSALLNSPEIVPPRKIARVG